MTWWKQRPAGRHRSAGTPRPPAPPPPSQIVTPTPDTERAIAAADAAADALSWARRAREKIDRLGDEIERENSKNGFRMMIEDALGGKA